MFSKIGINNLDNILFDNYQIGYFNKILGCNILNFEDIISKMIIPSILNYEFKDGFFIFKLSFMIKIVYLYDNQMKIFNRKFIQIKRLSIGNIIDGFFIETLIKTDKLIMEINSINFKINHLMDSKTFIDIQYFLSIRCKKYFNIGIILNNINQEFLICDSRGVNHKIIDSTVKSKFLKLKFRFNKDEVLYLKYTNNKYELYISSLRSFRNQKLFKSRVIIDYEIIDDERILVIGEHKEKNGVFIYNFKLDVVENYVDMKIESLIYRFDLKKHIFSIKDRNTTEVYIVDCYFNNIELLIKYVGDKFYNKNGYDYIIFFTEDSINFFSLVTKEILSYECYLNNLEEIINVDISINKDVLIITKQEEESFFYIWSEKEKVLSRCFSNMIFKNIKNPIFTSDGLGILYSEEILRTSYIYRFDFDLKRTTILNASSTVVSICKR